MSIQQEIECDNRSVLSALTTDNSQPVTPRISHLQLMDPIPELELPESENFGPVPEFSLEWKEDHIGELTTVPEDAEASEERRAFGRNARSDLSARLVKGRDTSGRTRVKSESLGILASENSVFKFLVSRKLSAQAPELYP